MRLLIAPDKFKGSLTAAQVAGAIAAGAREALHQQPAPLDIDLCPVADGGEGTLDVLHSALGGTIHTTTVHGPLGGDVPARWLLTPRAEAVIEMAAAAGLALVPPPARNPEHATTFGVGQLIDAARRAGARAILIGLGGSATVDGGLGCARALGWRFLDSQHRELTTPAELHRLTKILPGLPLGLPVTALCDVTNPLLGPAGAARTFGPQKGAIPDQVERLESALATLAHVARSALPHANLDALGSSGGGASGASGGAAGGLGFGLLAFLGARLVPGAAAILDAVNFDRRAAAADLVITGEGRLDAQTLGGKAVAEVARRAHRLGVPVLAVVGGTDRPPAEVRSALAAAAAPLADIESVTATGLSVDTAIQAGAGPVRAAAARLLARHLPSR